MTHLMINSTLSGGVSFVVVVALAAGWLLPLPSRAEEASAEARLLAAAKRIHSHAITLDTHVDIAGGRYATEKLDPGIDHPELKCDLHKMEQGGVDGVFLAVWTRQGKLDPQGYRQAWESAMERFAAIHRLTETMYPQRCEAATSPADVLRIVQSPKRAIMIGVENGYPLETDLAKLRKFYALGARYMTLCHVGHNQICDSSNPNKRLGDKEQEHHGLSEFGKQVVAEMNRLGMMIDVSHASRESFYDVLKASRAPVIASHSGCRARFDNARNLDDEQLEALAAGGGVIQIVAVGGFLNTPPPERKPAIREMVRRIGIPEKEEKTNFAEATEEQLSQYHRGIREIDRLYPAAGIEQFIDHIDHAVKVAGIDHVGIGSDFDGGGSVRGFENHSDAPRVTLELLRRGYSQEQIEKIWGNNLLRVWREVETVANRLRSTTDDE